MTRIGWRLTLEPEGTLLGWSLIRLDDDHPSGQVWSGLHEDLGSIRDAVRALHATHDPWLGSLTDPIAEAALARDLGLSLLPAPLRGALTTPDGAHHTVTIAARGWPSRMPWDALAVDWSGTRLVERAQVLAGMSPGLVAALPRRTSSDEQGCLWVVDPGPARGEFAPLFPAGTPRVITDALQPQDQLVPGNNPLTPDGLGVALRKHAWKSLVYLGHIRQAPQDSPAAAALVLGNGSDPDLLTAHHWLAEPSRWPAPPHTALIGCAGDDAGSLEQSGLVVAALAAGATVVTTTRWPLPNDDATTRLAAAVALASSSTEPATIMRRWQLLHLGRWRTSGERRHSPLLWASLAVYDLRRLQDGDHP